MCAWRQDNLRRLHCPESLLHTWPWSGIKCPICQRLLSTFHTLSIPSLNLDSFLFLRCDKAAIWEASRILNWCHKTNFWKKRNVNHLFCCKYMYLNLFDQLHINLQWLLLIRDWVTLTLNKSTHENWAIWLLNILNWKQRNSWYRQTM